MNLYLLGMAWFLATDCAASWVAGIRYRMLASLGCSLVWPVMMPFAIIGSALIIRRLKSNQPPSPERKR